MFKSTGSFDKLLDKTTSYLLMEPDWAGIIQICDLVRQDDIQPKYVIASIKKKLYSQNPHTAYYALQILESVVKNCGAVVQEELMLKANCEMLHDLTKTTLHENVRQKLLELIQAWTFAFRKNPKHTCLKETMNTMKVEGFKFPTLRESDAMFAADSAPEWLDGEVCHRCRITFGLVQRKHHCRNCGQVFCNQCSQKTTALPKFGIEKEVRVCDTCYDLVTKPASVVKKVCSGKQEDSDLPAEYLNSSLAQQSQMPPRKSEDELREEEELQLALALSQSEAEAKEKQKYRGTTSILSNAKSETHVAERTPSPLEEQSSELARYLNRTYWEGRQSEIQDTVRPTSPSAPATAPIQNSEPKYEENGLTDVELHDFISTLKSQVEIFINRMKSNSSRGRSIANDSSVQTLFLNITAMHSQLLRYIQQHDDSRLYYERLQDKLTQVKDARAALDALREEHREKLRRQAEEAERQRQMQMAQKLNIMRKKKQEFLEYQRQLALQRIQEQEREMQMRQEQQKQQYLMGSGYSTYKGSPVHGPYPSGNISAAAYRTYPYAQQIIMQGPPPMGPQSLPISHPQMQSGVMPQGIPQGPPPGIPQPLPQQAILNAMQHQPPPPPGMPPQSLSQPNLAQHIANPGLPPQQGLPPLQQGMPPVFPAMGPQSIPPNSAPSQASAGQMRPAQFQQPGAPPASPQIASAQQNGDAQTAELISFD